MRTFSTTILTLTLLLSLTLISQSCTSSLENTEVTLKGQILGNENNQALNGAMFTIIDNSPGATTFGDLIEDSDRRSIDVDSDGNFEIVFVPEEDITNFTYTYGLLRSRSLEIAIDVELGATTDLGVLLVEEPVQVQFTLPTYEYVNEDFIDFTTTGANDFIANTSSDSEVGGILRGYLYPNQLNTVVVSQSLDGEDVTETYQITTEDLSFDQEVELK